MTTYRICSKCGLRLPLSDFYRLSRGGWRADCRHCVIDQKTERAERFANGEFDAPHGRASTYVNLRCRCDDCRKAWSAYISGAAP